MASAARSSEIARAVRRLLAHPTGPENMTATVIRPVARTAMMGSIAMLALSPTVVNAVGLGEAQPRSALGEPLRATVPMRLANGEALRPGCVTAPAGKGRDFSRPKGATVRAPAGLGPGQVDLEITTRRPLYEPLYELTLQVDCPGLPKVMRHYVLMLDLPGMSLPAPAAVTRTSPGQQPPLSPASSSATRTPSSQRATPLAPNREPVSSGARYRVREGDTLSQIAARVEGRAPNATWALAEQIFAENPGAFIGGNPDLIKLGYEITIPVPGAAVTAPSDVRAAPAAEAAPASLLPPAEIESRPAVVEIPPAELVSPPENLAAASPAPVKQDVAPPAEDLKTADVSNDFVLPPASDSPFADVAENEPVANQAAEPPPVVLTPRDRLAVSPLLAVLLGLLLGLGLSIVLLRSRLLEGLSNLFTRGRAEPATKTQDSVYPDTDEWLKTEEGLHAEALAVGSPAEQTYIVEVENANESSQDLKETVVEGTAGLDVPFAPPDDAHEPDTGTEAAADEAHAKQDIDDLMAADPTATMEMPGTGEASRLSGTLETAEMPISADRADVPDGTNALQPNDLVTREDTGATAAMPEVDYDPTVEPDMAELFADDLSELPAEPDLPVEIFAGMEQEDADISTLPPTAAHSEFQETGELDDATAETPAGELEGLIADTRGTEAMELQGLSDVDDPMDSSHMSDTLQEAMSMLEKDFSDDLTASQIIDQSELRHALSESELAEEDFDDADLQGSSRKRAS